MTASEVLVATWRAAAADAGRRAGFYRRRLAHPGPDFALAGILIPDGRRQLSLELDAPAAPLPAVEGTRGFRVEMVTEPAGRVTLHINEASPPVTETLFTALGADLLGVASNAPAKSAALAVIRRLQHWRKFFQRDGEGLSVTEGVGLFAELEFLAACLDCGVDPEMAVTSWTGPVPANQDFSFGRSAVEIKATCVNDADRVQISNLRQLDDTGLGCLFLRHVAYDFRSSAGVTLSAAIAALRQRLDAAARNEFDSRLIAYGCLEPITGTLATHGFTLRNRRHFRVKEGFPRLLEGTVPQSVVDVHYTVALAGCTSFEVTEAEVLESGPMS